MANNYCVHTAERCIPCTESVFSELTPLLDDDSGHGFTAEFSEGELYLYAEDGCTDDLPKAFLAKLGAVVRDAGLPYLEFGFASTCDKARAGSHGGGSYRIMPDGSIVYPAIVWP